MRPFHLAILECDTPLSRTEAKYGGYGDVFTALLRSGAEALGEPDLIINSSDANSSSNGISNSTSDRQSEDGKGADGERQRRSLRITKWGVEKDMRRYPGLDDIDGILVTGSSESQSLSSMSRPSPISSRSDRCARDERGA